MMRCSRFTQVIETLAVLVVTFGFGAHPGLSQDRPLLMPGKDSLSQRVLIRDATSAFDAPNGTGAATVSPLTPLFVYAREDSWLRVGHTETGADLFWVPEVATTPWNQNIVATIEPSENIGRLLFFAEPGPIYDLLELETPGKLAQEYRASAEAAEQGGAPPEKIVALGPRRVVDQRRNLYVMPIIDYEEEVFDNGPFVNLLRVAVARAQPGAAPEQNSHSDPGQRIKEEKPADGSRDDEGYKLGVVFVVDTTISMDPYIDGTRDALREVYRAVDEAGMSDSVSFALIGYRDNLAAAPALDYAKRTFVSLKDGTAAKRFLDGIGAMGEAGVSSLHYREDAYAGIEHAINSLDWSGFDGRFVVLVTNASPREAGDEYSQTGMSGLGMNQMVRERINGAIAVLHLKTPDGKNDHARAEAAYRDLARFPNQAPFYYPIEDGNEESFRESARALGTILAQDVQRFRNSPEYVDRKAEQVAERDTAQRFAGLISAGRTMQLAYLGRTNGTRAPDVFEAYVADRDFERTGLKPLSIRVLISKAQLSALYDALQVIIEKGEENVVEPDQFFAQVLGAAADMSRNPDKVARQSDPSLAQAVAIDEYIEDLPYHSRIMNVTEDDWLDMSFSEQASIINELYDKIERYAQYNETTDLWVDYLGTGRSAKNLLYPLSLDDLP